LVISPGQTQDPDAFFFDRLRDLKTLHQGALPQSNDYVPDHRRSSVWRFFHS